MVSIPENITFEEAITLTQSLLDDLESETLPASEVEQAVTALVSTENGARGFFVTYLSEDRPLADYPSAAIVQALQSSPAIVAELLVKNLAMSSAMAVVHRRNHDEAMAAGSDRVRSRTQQLIYLVHVPEIQAKATRLHESAVTGTGDYQAFLQRWNYDAEQRQVIQQAIEQVMSGFGG
jgi:hypothetical protein